LCLGVTGNTSGFGPEEWRFEPFRHNIIKLLNIYYMIIIENSGKDSIDKMLKKYKQKLKRTKQIRNIREGKEYTKPSVKKRVQKLKAIYIQKLRDQEQKRS
jgi:small subunit ribosomal protein S21